MTEHQPKRAQRDDPVVAASVAEFFRRLSVYPERRQWVEVRETIVWWVFLTDIRAYGLQRSIKFDFQDFRTRALRYLQLKNELSHPLTGRCGRAQDAATITKDAA